MLKFRFAEIAQMCTGLGILISVPLIFFYGNFNVWFFAKIAYVLGITIMLIKK